VLDKVADATLDAWGALLKKVPDSRLLLKSRSLVQDSFIAKRIRDEFATRGVEPNRIDLAGWVDSPQGHLDAYRQVDIAVDTFPYNGTTTTCEALWMGVPVIALRGPAHGARVGASLLSAVGLADLVAEDTDGYVAAAVSLAVDKERLVALRAGLRQRVAASPLCDEKAFVSRFEATIRRLWREWCAMQKSK
jgi:predicted O-linked N-acetylglucosamine transferase (SPINDLY family)